MSEAYLLYPANVEPNGWVVDDRMNGRIELFWEGNPNQSMMLPPRVARLMARRINQCLDARTKRRRR